MKRYSHLSICSVRKSGLRISCGASPNQDIGYSGLKKIERTVVLEDYESNRPASGNDRGEKKLIRKQEEWNGGGVRSRKGDEYDDLVILSGREGGEEVEIEWL